MGKKSLLENSTLFLNYYLPMNAKTGKSLEETRYLQALKESIFSSDTVKKPGKHHLENHD